ncbi:CopL family metal-binding regulatory protein [Luteimonas huabeiensis]|uniref:CopL family metal-binding regulatory protein n=1 Tax=Luteimonas huabeiensis TaxID=1244513 RepID=UPI0004636571|nr:CopL family metal-binding regulatory protein [Luteimonas huabeiensis]
MPQALLRLLLCASLLINGLGSAVASAHVALASEALARSAATADAHAPAGTDCPHAAAAADAPADPGGPAGAGEVDCIERCLDLCLQHAPLAPAPPRAGPLPPASTLRGQDRPAPASRAPFPPTRPPIAA